MNYEEFIAQYKNDPEYISGKEALRLHFALGEAVLRARMKRNWSQTELARLIGTKQANISRIESAMGNPTLELIKKIMDVLELEIIFAPRAETTTSVEVIYQAEHDNPFPWPIGSPKPAQIVSTFTQNNWSTR